MSTASEIIRVAFDLHKEGKLPKEDLIEILQKLINAAALDNGYADRFGLPFPEKS